MTVLSPYLKVVLLLAALRLATLILGIDGASVQAQSDYSHLYIEPGTTVLRDPDNGGQAQGKVVIDRRTGDVWGFPTASSAPFPVVLSRKEPPVSRPIYLGRFDFSAMKK